jgi:hypothetical protein
LNRFIPIIRTDRKREINKYKNLNYFIADEKEYRLIDRIRTLQPKCTFDFGVEANNREIYFYIIKDGSNTFFSIYEIYEELYNIAIREGSKFVIDILKEQANIKIEEKENSKTKEKQIVNQEKFMYRGVEYYIKKTVEIDKEKDGKINPKDSSVEITYQEFFTLINLIQEKSNTLFLWRENDKTYVNGLMRLLIVLLSNNEDMEILLQKGWKYDEDNEKYILDVKRDKEINKSKYYLTEDDYNNIINKES